MDPTVLIGKRITIYYNDLSRQSPIARKDGTLHRETSYAIYIMNSNGYVEAIPWTRIVRIIEQG